VNDRAGKATAIVIGAGRVFGNEIVARLAAEGYRVIAADATLPRLDPGIAGATAMRLDATDPAAVAALFAQERSVAVLVLNSPVSVGTKRFIDILDAELDAALNLSVVEPVCVVHEGLGSFIRGGSIVLVASRAHLGAWGGAHMMAAGATAITMSRVMALELENSGVRVNVVAPDFIEEIKPEAPRQVAGIVAFLASAASEPVSGQTLLVNGTTSLQLRESVYREMP
jgi:NAD(P)-dependent dehydrogenase (short-subunit alcohol dehydrogenase family)